MLFWRLYAALSLLEVNSVKKIISVVILVALLFSFSLAVAETNLSEMSYDELIALQKDITNEIMSRPEWKEVEVPAGQYTIGVDIPAGWYSMKPKSKWDSVYLRWYPNPDNDYWDYLRTDDIARFELKEGMRIYLEQTTIFAPARSLGF